MNSPVSTWKDEAQPCSQLLNCFSPMNDFRLCGCRPRESRATGVNRKVIFGSLKLRRRPHKLNGNKCESVAAVERETQHNRCSGAPSFRPSSLNLQESPTFRTEARVMNRGKLGDSLLYSQNAICGVTRQLVPDVVLTSKQRFTICT